MYSSLDPGFPWQSLPDYSCRWHKIHCLPWGFYCFYSTLTTCMPDGNSPNIRLFADDCLLYIQFQSHESSALLQSDLNKLSAWSSKWQLRVNPTKCFVMHISRKCTPLITDYFLYNTHLAVTKIHPYLGIELSDDLRWNSHGTRITNKANSTLGFVRRNLYHCRRLVKETAYMSLVRSSLKYCSSVWDPHTLTNINKLEMVQRRAARFVVNDYNKDSSVSDILRKLERTSLQIRRKNNRLAQMFKIVNNLSAISPNDYLTPSKSVTRRNHNFKFIQYSLVTDCFKYSFFPRTVPEWNTLLFLLAVSTPSSSN